jgi:adenylate cyclase
MAVEIERKFLVRPGCWTPRQPGDHIRQGYIPTTDVRTVRVRVRADRAFLTIKGPTTGRMSRLEFEYSIPVDDAHEMLDRLCSAVLEKHRYLEPYGAHTWEIDVFSGANAGLVLAEVELQTEDDLVELPPWVGDEVTGDARYANGWLAHHPFSTWG